MDAGRELDELVATEVMGWRLAEGNVWVDVANNSIYWEEWKPSEDIAAAWEVVEQTALLIDRNLRQEWGGEWLISALYDGADILAAADTAPHAICLAALKAKGVEVCGN